MPFWAQNLFLHLKQIDSSLKLNKQMCIWGMPTPFNVLITSSGQCRLISKELSFLIWDLMYVISKSFPYIVCSTEWTSFIFLTCFSWIFRMYVSIKHAWHLAQSSKGIRYWINIAGHYILGWGGRGSWCPIWKERVTLETQAFLCKVLTTDTIIV